MPSRRLLVRVAFLAGWLLWGPSPVPAGADAGSGSRRAAAPADNSSHVADDDPGLRKSFEEATEDLRRERWHAAAERLQGVVDLRWEDPAAGRAVGHVLSVGGAAVYEGAWIVARHMLVRHGEPLRAAYAGLYGASARAMLERAAVELDEVLLAELVRRFLPLPEGRAAALLLADAAVERGDADEAFARLEALEDVEEAGDEPEETVRPWREARLAREARLLARAPGRVPAVREHLARAAAVGARAAVLEERVPWSERAPRTSAATWSTTGGAPDRAAFARTLGFPLGPTARARLTTEEGAEEQVFAALPPALGPSPWLPPRAVVGRTSVFVNDGETLWAFDRATQREQDHLPLRRREEAGGDEPFRGRVRADDPDDPRAVLPLIEGHVLTLDEPPGAPARLYVACCRRILHDASVGRERLPDSSLAAFVWDGSTLMRRWQAGGAGSLGALPSGISLHGAPCLYRGRLWVAGARPTEATSDRLEAWLFALDPETGAPRVQVRLGSGSPVRAGRLDEAVPSSPAAAHGRVVVSTSLGFVAAVDAEDGRIAWLYRYDRGLESGKARRMGSEVEDLTPRLTGFANEPPVIAFGRTFVAPTDSNQLYALMTRPRGELRDLVGFDPRDRRTDFRQMAVEYVVGAVGGFDGIPPQIVVVGKGDAGEGEPPAKVVSGIDPVQGLPLWDAPTATGRIPMAYGRAVLTDHEVYVPTAQGILVIDLTPVRLPGQEPVFAREVGTLGPGLFPDGERGPPALWTGNLVPLPGQGLLAVNRTHLSFWLKR